MSTKLTPELLQAMHEREQTEYRELTTNDDRELSLWLVRHVTELFEEEVDYDESDSDPISKMGRERALQAAARILFNATERHDHARRAWDAACHKVNSYETEPHRTTEWLARQRRAHQAVAKAIADGTLVRPDECEKCGKHAVVVAHHRDYDKPLDVDWWCKPCHGDWHANNGPAK